MMADERDKTDALKAVIWCNIALCRIHQDLYDRAIDAATECLRLDKENTKALHRRSQAHEKLGQLEEALSDSTKLKKLGDGHLNAKESEEEERRREQLWERLQKENRAIDEVAKAQEPYWMMRDRFNALVDKYDLGDGQFFSDGRSMAHHRRRQRHHNGENKKALEDGKIRGRVWREVDQDGSGSEGA